ncbi:putative lipoprotein [Devosia crocina]|uniref:Putative lipoprotein n=1 Tax=Devosia crocina TaxID=429728 RepID=A0A1I7N484_9HYPH|nr:META domain-containing protein [Devosia crocina]SFV29477.1 putative lipoprotein [Devosia crocina]
MLKPVLALALLLLVMIAPAQAAHLTVTGEVFYRERIALPQGATLYVGLVTMPSGNPVVGAGAAIPIRGQVPLQFSLNIRSDTATEAGPLGVVAEIRSGQTVLFRSSAAVPVDLLAPGPVSILVTRQKLQEPVPEPPTLDPRLIGTVWTVTSIAGSPAQSDTPMTLEIAPDLRADGSAGCNSYFTQASLDDTALRFGLAAATRKACTPRLMAQETAFFAALAATAGYEISGNSLRLLDAAGIPLIGLVASGE